MRSTFIPILPSEDRLPQTITEEIAEGNIYHSRPMFLCYISGIKKHKVVSTRAHHELISIDIEIVELMMRRVPNLLACAVCVCMWMHGRTARRKTRR